jgi:hypothetical protein
MTIWHSEFDLDQPADVGTHLRTFKALAGDCRHYPKDAVSNLDGASKTNRLTFAHSEHW